MNDRTPFRRLSRDVLIDNRWHRYCRVIVKGVFV